MIDPDARAKATAEVLTWLDAALGPGFVATLGDCETAHAAVVDALLQRAAETIVGHLLPRHPDPELVQRMAAAARDAFRREWVAVYGHPYEQEC